MIRAQIGACMPTLTPTCLIMCPQAWISVRISSSLILTPCDSPCWRKTSRRLHEFLDICPHGPNVTKRTFFDVRNDSGYGLPANDSSGNTYPNPNNRTEVSNCFETFTACGYWFEYHYSAFFVTYDNGMNRASFNNITFVPPLVPTVMTVDSAPVESVTNTAIYGPQSNVYLVEGLEIVELKVINWDSGNHPCESSPSTRIPSAPRALC